jgi:hypothetical protein
MKKINKNRNSFSMQNSCNTGGAFIAMELQNSMGPRSHPTNAVLLTKAFKKTIEALQQKIQSGKTFCYKKSLQRNPCPY